MTGWERGSRGDGRGGTVTPSSRARPAAALGWWRSSTDSDSETVAEHHRQGGAVPPPVPCGRDRLQPRMGHGEPVNHLIWRGQRSSPPTSTRAARPSSAGGLARRRMSPGRELAAHEEGERVRSPRRAWRRDHDRGCLFVARGERLWMCWHEVGRAQLGGPGATAVPLA
jgi:hypothetical protein